MKETGIRDIPAKDKTARAKSGKDTDARDKFPKDGGAAKESADRPKAAKAKAKTAPIKAPKTIDAPSVTAAAVEIDYPAEEEAIIPGHYAIRISAPGEGFVEVSVDGEVWRGCRYAVGYYWADWWPGAAGTHTIRARHHDGSGSIRESAARRCDVAGPSVS